jgi:energy-converting hydrogenase A subunit M
MADPKYVDIGHPITKLIEECSELIKILCKADRFGLYSCHPKTPGINNLTKLTLEKVDIDLAYANLLEKIDSIKAREK